MVVVVDAVLFFSIDSGSERAMRSIRALGPKLFTRPRSAGNFTKSQLLV